MTISQLPDHLLNPTQHDDIAELLQLCFPQYPRQRTYFRQLPHFRVLAYTEAGLLCGHIAIEHRMVNNAGQLYRIFGLADVCVHPEQRTKGLGAKMLGFLAQLAHDARIDALLLIAHDPEFYTKNDFLAVENDCKWLFIQGDQTLGVLNRHVNGLMVKMLNGQSWKNGPLDLLGHIF